MSEETSLEKVDRTDWDPGPWDAEEDRYQWKTRSGLPGLIVRNNLGNLCGYAAVAPGHAMYGKSYETPDVDVHGGLTFGSKCHGAICHIPDPGEPDDVWWFGFDCAHAGDLLPARTAMAKRIQGYPKMRGEFDGTYRDVAYVRAQVEDLARQLAEMA